MTLWYWLIQELTKVQREIYLAFADRISAFSETGEWSLLMVYLPLGIVFGAVHAMTPGHSKLVLATYVAGSLSQAADALRVSLVLSFVHVSIAVIIASLALPLVSSALGSAGQAPLIDDVSRGLVGLIGFWIIWQAVCEHQRTAGQYGGAAFGVAAGLVPCPLTLFVMTYAISKKVPEAGVAFAIVMVIGVALTLSTVALLAVLFRSFFLQLAAARNSTIRSAAVALQVLTGVILVIVAVNEVFAS